MEYRIINIENTLKRGDVDFKEEKGVLSIDFLTENGILSVSCRDGIFEISSSQGPLAISPKVSNCVQIEVK